MADTAARGPRSHRGVTLTDVAREAGVSLSTVSKAFKGRTDVAAATRSRILRTAEQMGYQLAAEPSAPVQAAPAKRNTIGFITHDFEGRFSIPLLAGVEDQLESRNLIVLLCNARGDTIRERHYIDALIEQGVQGLVIVDPRPDVRPSVGPLAVPVVYAYAPSDSDADCSVVSDNVRGGWVAADHLVSLGRSRIAVIGGDLAYGAAEDRVQGIEQRLAVDGLGVLGGKALYGSWTEEWGWAGARTILRDHPEVDAFICGNDQIARGVLEAVRVDGRSVPHDVSVMGHDNFDMLVEGSRPPLTSIDMNMHGIGAAAARCLTDLISGRGASGIRKIEPRLVVRGSTGP